MRGGFRAAMRNETPAPESGERGHRSLVRALAESRFSCQIEYMTFPDDRRSIIERRALERRAGLGARPYGGERRMNGERRSGLERRLSVLNAEGQIHEALRLLTQAIDRRIMPDDELRLLESAMVRLRFSLDQLDDEIS